MNKSQPYYIKSHQHYSQKRINTMIYYLFPRSSVFVNTNCKITYSTQKPCASFSHSLSTYKFELLNYAKIQLPGWNENCIKYHHYSQLNSISNIQRSSTFYELLEIFRVLDISFDLLNQIYVLHFYKDTFSFVHYFRNENNNEEPNILDKCFLFDKQYTLSDFPTKCNPMFNLIFCQAFKGNEYKNAIDLLLQLCISICTIKKKGTIIIKYGETYSKLSLEIMILFSFFFKKCVFIKPSANMPTSSDKYFVCTNFIFENIGDKMYNTIFEMYKSVLSCNDGVYIESILTYKIPLFVTNKMEEINSIFGQTQLEHIHHLMSSIEESNINTYDTPMMCKQWCEKYKVPILSK